MSLNVSPQELISTFQLHSFDIRTPMRQILAYRQWKAESEVSAPSLIWYQTSLLSTVSRVSLFPPVRRDIRSWTSCWQLLKATSRLWEGDLQCYNLIVIIFNSIGERMDRWWCFNGYVRLGCITLTLSVSSSVVVWRYFLSGVDVNAVDYDGRSAMHVAAAEGQMEVIRFLLENANANTTLKDRWEFACWSQSGTLNLQAIWWKNNPNVT